MAYYIYLLARFQKSASIGASEVITRPKTMKFSSLIFSAALFAFADSALAGGFVNLDFEDATIAPTPPGGFGSFADPAQAFPGWTVGGGPTSVSYNDLSLGGPAISLMGPDFPNGPGFTPLQGSYSVFLQYFEAESPPTLSQTGLVPSGAQSLNFLDPNLGNPSIGVVVSLNGIDISLASIGGGRLGGNLPAGIAGTSALLMFTTTTGHPDMDGAYIDDIQFSPSIVPEPSAFAIFALGALSLGFRRWRKSAR
jgi:hypothetical protein